MPRAKSTGRRLRRTKERRRRLKIIRMREYEGEVRDAVEGKL